ncbi:hypothetical protein PCI56_22775 [Plesiomonas shigelloides subsp. oncorhynchi]|nr:hypothetical protein [Plesiomonas shigelloides]
MDEVYQRLKLMMERENLTGGVELEMLGQQLLIRMNEGVAFAAGSAFCSLNSVRSWRILRRC